MLVAILVLCSVCAVLLGVNLWVVVDHKNQFIKQLENVKQDVSDLTKTYETFSETISALVLLLPAVLKVSKKVEGFEQFFEDTLEDISGVIEMLDKLMKRQLVSDDPDVQSFYRVMAITHDVLLGYRNAKEERSQEKE